MDTVESVKMPFVTILCKFLGSKFFSFSSPLPFKLQNECSTKKFSCGGFSKMMIPLK